MKNEKSAHLAPTSLQRVRGPIGVPWTPLDPSELTLAPAVKSLAPGTDRLLPTRIWRRRLGYRQAGCSLLRGLYGRDGLPRATFQLFVAEVTNHEQAATTLQGGWIFAYDAANLNPIVSG